MKLLVKIASRSRPAQLVNTVRQFVRNAAHTANLSFIISMDNDDLDTVNQVRQVIGGIKAVDIRVGSSKCKVEAINRDLEGAHFDAMIVAADDQAPCQSYDVNIERDFARLWPNYDGAIHYNDGHTGTKLNTIPVIGYNLFRKFGYVYHPDYTSLWCDNEYTELLRAMGRLSYSEVVMVRHNHPSYTGQGADALLARNEGFYAQDEAVYRRRLGKVRPESKWAFDSPDIMLSILIPSLVQRAPLRRQILEELNKQINANAQRRRIEIWMDIDGGATPVGVKRSNLLQRANGRFVCFVDDDDMVAPTYIDDIVAAIMVNLEADCIGLEGIITSNGGNPRRFIHSITTGGYYERDGVYYRTPNHLNPVRTDHARAAGFPGINCGEDREYAERLFRSGRLKTETMIPKPLYFYRFDTNKTATQRR